MMQAKRMCSWQPDANTHQFLCLGAIADKTLRSEGQAPALAGEADVSDCEC